MYLYGSIASPFVQRVLMAARAKGHDIEVRAPLGGDMKSAEFRAISPMVRIPVLALDDGTHICESAAIAGYLDETLDGPALMPDDALERARVREIVSITTGEIGVAMRPMMVHLVFRMGEAPQVIDASRAQLAQGRDALDRLLDDRTLDDGAALTLADCALVPVLTLVDIVEPMTGAWTALAARASIPRYFEAAKAHPIAGRTITEMKQAFAQIMARNAA